MKTKSIKSIKLITYIVKNQVIDIPEGTIFNLEEVDGVDYFIKEDDPDVILSYQIAIQNPEYFEDWNFTRKYDAVFEMIEKVAPKIDWDEFANAIDSRYRMSSLKKRIKEKKDSSLNKGLNVGLPFVSIIPEFHSGILYQYSIKNRE
jgi:hypothetical protein